MSASTGGYYCFASAGPEGRGSMLGSHGRRSGLIVATSRAAVGILAAFVSLAKTPSLGFAQECTPDARSDVGEIGADASCAEPAPVPPPHPGPAPAMPGSGGQQTCSVLPVSDWAAEAGSRILLEASSLDVEFTDTPRYQEGEATQRRLNSVGVFLSMPFRVVGGSVEVLHDVDCDGELADRTEWITIGPDGRAMPTPQQFLPQLQDSVTERVPAPVARIAPADEDRNGWTYANFDTYFWVDAGPGQWDVVSATASVPGLSVTVQAVPQRLVVDPGDGSGAFSCEGRPPVASNDVWYDGMPGCIHRYVNSSSMSGNGETFRVTVAIDWAVRWSASNGESGSLGGLRTSGSRDLAVAEIQAINVPNP